ncbi:MAG: hypothetical protein M1834_003024 [Cirrosporium novae-zelandiae]|nr:MAG: hypothetical protein M1834_003024 [Cirrosporium novae-zelandiae]
MLSGPPAAVAYVSTVIGFVSFAVSLGTFIHVFWDNLNTLWAAPSQVKITLSNLKEELFEEREYLKKARKRERTELYGIQGPPLIRTMTGKDAGVPIKVMQESVKDLCRQFKDLEMPFLKDPLDRDNRGWDPERYMKGEPGDEYICKSMDVIRRIIWTRRKIRAEDIERKLVRLQTRRIAREVTDVLLTIHHIDKSLGDLRLVPRRSPSRDNWDEQDDSDARRVRLRRF